MTQALVLLGSKHTSHVSHSSPLGQGFSAFRPQTWVLRTIETPLGGLQTPGIENVPQTVRILLFFHAWNTHTHTH